MPTKEKQSSEKVTNTVQMSLFKALAFYVVLFIVLGSGYLYYLQAINANTFNETAKIFSAAIVHFIEIMIMVPFITIGILARMIIDNTDKEQPGEYESKKPKLNPLDFVPKFLGELIVSLAVSIFIYLSLQSKIFVNIFYQSNDKITFESNATNLLLIGLFCGYFARNLASTGKIIIVKRIEQLDKDKKDGTQ